MNLHALTLVLVALFVSGCAAPPAAMPPTAWPISAPFDSAEATRLMQDGVNMVRGNAFMRQRGGGVVTCAGSPVTLIPATAYAKERVTAIYGSSAGGATRTRMTFTPDPAAFQLLTKKTTCDAQGNFQFDRVADGDFYVQTVVAWEVARSVQGGSLLRLISVRNGQAVNVVLSS